MTLRLRPEADLTPYTAGFPPGERWLVLAPHADDEVLGPGATLALARERGVEVAVVVVTDGAEQGDAGVREAEALEASRRLGVPSPRFLRFGDRTLAASVRRLESAVLEVIAHASPDTVLVTSPVELHPDHRALAIALQRAVRRGSLLGVRRGPPAWVAAYEVGTPLRPNLLVAADAGWERKRAALACYASQLAVTRYDRVMEAFGALRSLTLSGCDHAEAMHVLPAAQVVRRSARSWAALMGSPVGVGAG